MLLHTSVISNITEIYLACVPEESYFLNNSSLHFRAPSICREQLHKLFILDTSLASLCVSISYNQEKLNGIVISHPQFSQEHFFALYQSNFCKSFLDCHDPRRTKGILVFLTYRAKISIFFSLMDFF